MKKVEGMILVGNYGRYGSKSLHDPGSEYAPRAFHTCAVLKKKKKEFKDAGGNGGDPKNMREM